MDKLFQTIKYIRNQTDKKASLGIILGSGFGKISHHIKEIITFPYKNIPYFVSSTVPGHKGNLIIGKLFGHNVVVMNGRFHLYEGYNVEEVSYPVWVMKKLGIKKLFVTNAAGAINENFPVGDLMIITDHINLLDLSSLYKVSLLKKEEAFIDATSCYDEKLIRLAQKCASTLGIRIDKGVYAAVKGTYFESTAEAKMLRILGADAVGMSTVPEVVVAKYLGMKVLAISCITNIAGDCPLTHQEVLKINRCATAKLSKLIEEIFKQPRF